MTATVALSAVDDLDGISLEELLTVAELQTRRDRKYLVPHDRVDGLIAGSAACALSIGELRVFRYESVYFDTDHLVSYLGAARRRPRRFKVRTRSYVDSCECMVEVKTRDARGQTVKHRRPHPFNQSGELDEAARRFVATIEPAAVHVDALRPQMAIRYRRATLLDQASASRITIDVDVSWLDPAGSTIDLPGFALIETKTSGKACAFDRALWRAGIRPLTISKYCTGLAAITRDVPSNKWHRVLGRHFATPSVVSAAPSGAADQARS